MFWLFTKRDQILAEVEGELKTKYTVISFQKKKKMVIACLELLVYYFIIKLTTCHNMIGPCVPTSSPLTVKIWRCLSCQLLTVDRHASCQVSLRNDFSFVFILVITSLLKFRFEWFKLSLIRYSKLYTSDSSKH